MFQIRNNQQNIRSSNEFRLPIPHTVKYGTESLRYLQSWQKHYGQLRKTALSVTPQSMYSQFKRPSAWSVSELYYIFRKT